jgi:hypothetical protein
MPHHRIPIAAMFLKSALAYSIRLLPADNRRPQTVAAVKFDYDGTPHLFDASDAIMTDMPTHSPAMPDDSEPDRDVKTQEPRLWRDVGWTARVIKNEDDEGWAVEMIKDGEPEPALVGPWTMGRDKKNPKPLDTAAFNTLVKTASEVLRRHEQQLHAMLHKSIVVTVRSATLNVALDIVPDEDDPYALLTAFDDAGEQIAQVRVAPAFKLNAGSATAWVENEFRKPG